MNCLLVILNHSPPVHNQGHPDIEIVEGWGTRCRKVGCHEISALLIIFMIDDVTAHDLSKR